MKVAANLSFLSILWSFLKLAPVSFGGGYALYPLLEKEIVRTRGWMDEKTFADTLTLAASSPGGVGINAALFVGYRIRGPIGALAAGIGAIVPTILIVIALFVVCSRFGSSAKVKAALSGVTWGVVTLVLFAAIKMGRSAIKDYTSLGLMLAGLACLLAGVHPIYLIGGGIVLGFLLTGRNSKRNPAKQDPPAPAEPPMYMI